jgi:hypothetical protein
MQRKRFSSSDHIVINTAQELFESVTVDPALWIATSAPVSCFDADEKFLNHLDVKQQKRILFDNVISEVEWLKKLYIDYSAINISSDLFDINSINQDSSDGQKIAQIYQSIIAKVGGNYVSLAVARDTLKEITENSVSETGVVIPTVAVSSDIKSYIELAIKVTKGVPHPSGGMGINADALDKFNNILSKYLDWKQKYIAAEKNSNADSFLPYGTDTETLYLKFKSYQNKIEQYFAQCKALSFSQQLSNKVEFLNDINFAEFNWQDATKLNTFLQEAPLANPNDKVELKYDNQLIMNPAFYNGLQSFLNTISDKSELGLNGKLNETTWCEIKEIFSEFENWYANNPSVVLNDVDLTKIQVFISTEYSQAVEHLIAQSIKTKEKLVSINLLEKAILYQKNIIPFVRNFIGFVDLYTPGKDALFEKGTLIMDGHKFNFAIDVPNVAEHKSIANNSYIYLLYVDVIKPDKNKISVAIPVTRGVKGSLVKGKRGVFIDTKGNKMDAVVTDIIANPISLKEALLEPFIKVKQLLSKKIDDDATQQELNLTKSTTDVVSGKDPQAKTSASKPLGGMNTGAILMGGGVAIAALGSSITYIIDTISDASLKNILIIVGVIIFAFVCPIIISAILKLRKRDMTPILEGSGWAINVRMRLTRKISREFTQKPKWPKQVKRKR